MKIIKKIVIFAVILSVVLSFSSCVKDKRFDYSELNIRLKKDAPEFVFDESEIFFSDSVYYVYYSLNSEDDMLLTLKEDERMKLERITLTLDSKKAEESGETFRKFALALANIFIPELNESALIDATGINDVSSYTSDIMKSYTEGFYKAVLFCSGEAACFMLLYG
ncbi:MAG: hypothetical protein J1E34_01825 [Oscillospiraceae bacterium]|nr:hypothetical protein [Oscillospiraceae bacterium]